MAVYPDKTRGALNGRWRVDLQKGNQRYRARHETRADALADEDKVKALWAAGDGPQGTVISKRLPTVHTIASASHEARGTLWKGRPGEETSWAHIRIIGEIIGSEKPLDEIATPHLTKVIRELGRTGRSDATINRYMSHFRSFLIWAEQEGLKTTSISALTFRWNKETAGRIRWITPAEEADLQRLLPSKVWKLVKVAIETGCRRDELLTLEPRDLQGNLLHLWVTKTDNPRTIPVSDETRALLLDLFVAGMPTKRSLRSCWERARAKMGLTDDKQFCFHVTRHTCATRMVDAGEDVLVIKEWLGHKRIETTQRYAHVKPSNLLDALKRRGIVEALMAEEARKTAGNTRPPTSPNVGGIAPLQVAA